MMTAQEVFDILVKMNLFEGRKSNESLSLNQRQFIEQYYTLTTGRPFHRTSCGSCYVDFGMEMFIKLKQKTTFEMKNEGFILKRGEVLMSPGVNSVISGLYPPREEDVLEHLSKFPNKIRKFQVYPDDWMQRVENYKKSKETPIEIELELPDQEESISSNKELGDIDAECMIGAITNDLLNGVRKGDIELRYKGMIVEGKKISVRSLKELIKEADTRLSSK